MLEEISQIGGGCLIPGSIQDQAGWGCEQPNLVEKVPDHCRGVGLHGPWKCLSTQFFFLSFYD